MSKFIERHALFSDLVFGRNDSQFRGFFPHSLVVNGHIYFIFSVFLLKGLRDLVPVMIVQISKAFVDLIKLLVSVRIELYLLLVLQVFLVQIVHIFLSLLLLLRLLQPDPGQKVEILVLLLLLVLNTLRFRFFWHIFSLVIV